MNKGAFFWGSKKPEKKQPIVGWMKAPVLDHSGNHDGWIMLPKRKGEMHLSSPAYDHLFEHMTTDQKKAKYPDWGSGKMRSLDMNKTAAFEAGLEAALEKVALMGKATALAGLGGAVMGAAPGAAIGAMTANKGERWRGAGRGALAGGALGGAALGGLTLNSLRQMKKVDPDAYAEMLKHIQDLKKGGI